MSSLTIAARRVVDPKNPVTVALGKTFFDFTEHKGRGKTRGKHAKELIDGHGHHRRTDIVSARLCTDVLKYLGPTLIPYKGCTIIDVNPGACLWTKKLHQLLKPKRHILLESDELYFEPFIRPLLKRPNSTFQHKHFRVDGPGSYIDAIDGALVDLNPSTREQQSDVPDAKLRLPDTSVLITGNLARKFVRAKEVGHRTPPLSHVLLSAFASASLRNLSMHRDGLVRMLWWIPDHEKSLLLPLRGHHVLPLTATLNLGATITEAAATEPGIAYMPKHRLRGGQYTVHVRPPAFATQTGQIVKTRMQSAGMKKPRNRQLLPTTLTDKGHFVPIVDPMRNPARRGIKSPLVVVHKTLEELEEAVDGLETRITEALDSVMRAKAFTNPTKAEKVLTSFLNTLEYPQAQWQPSTDYATSKGTRFRWAGVGSGPDVDELGMLASEMRMAVLLDLHLRIINLEASYSALNEQAQSNTAIRERLLKLDEACRATGARLGNYFNGAMDVFLDDNIAVFATPQPLLLDQRSYEALQANVDEFWPKANMALLDFVPKQRDLAIPGLAGRDEVSRTAFDLIKALLTFKSVPLPLVLDRIASNAAQDVIPMAPAITDARKGGRLNPMNVRVRALTDEMIEDLVKAWYEWPFKPEEWQLALAAGEGGGGSVTDEDALTPEAVADA